MTHSSIKLTHPDKVMYPELKITKLDVLQYYESVSSWMLPYIIDRPITLVRCPENYKHTFYQKHLAVPRPHLSKNDTIYSTDDNYIYIKDCTGLLSLVQMSVLEIHPWGSTIKKLDYPDIMIFDLDPDATVPWKQVVLTAKRIQSHLAELKLRSFVKTTGGKGLHVVVPIKPKFDWANVKNFAHVFVSFIAAEYPNEYVTQMSKEKRRGKIFIDYLRNTRGATAIAPYSTRARKQASVSVPLDWDELTDHIKDTSFNLLTIVKRLTHLKKDPWHDFFTIKQSLPLDNYLQGK